MPIYFPATVTAISASSPSILRLPSSTLRLPSFISSPPPVAHSVSPPVSLWSLAVSRGWVGRSLGLYALASVSIHRPFRFIVHNNTYIRVTVQLFPLLCPLCSFIHSHSQSQFFSPFTNHLAVSSSLFFICFHPPCPVPSPLPVARIIHLPRTLAFLVLAVCYNLLNPGHSDPNVSTQSTLNTRSYNYSLFSVLLLFSFSFSLILLAYPLLYTIFIFRSNFRLYLVCVISPVYLFPFFFAFRFSFT